MAVDTSPVEGCPSRGEIGSEIGPKSGICFMSVSRRYYVGAPSGAVCGAVEAVFGGCRPHWGKPQFPREYFSKDEEGALPATKPAIDID